MSIRESRFQPTEVLLCVPEREASKLLRFSDSLVKVVTTKNSGQVSQRAEGLKLASGNIVAQMDDDIILDVDTLGSAVRYLTNLGPGNVLGPVFKDLETEDLSQADVKILKGIRRWYLINIGRLPKTSSIFGAFSSLTCTTGINLKNLNRSLIPVMWLPGGFVLSFKQDLITSNFYPFFGKAYYEDLIHSQLRLRRAIRHYVACDIIVKTAIATNNNRNSKSIDELTLEILNFSVHRWRVARRLGAGRVRLSIYLFSEIVIALKNILFEK